MLAGIAFSVLAALMFTIGNLVEKHAVDQMAALEARQIGVLLRRLLGSRMWLTGFVVSLFALGFQVIAFSLAPLVVVQVINNAGLVLLVFVSRRRFHERISRRDGAGLAVLILALACVSGSLGSKDAVGVGGSPLVVVVVVAVTAVVVLLVLAGLSGWGVDVGLLFGISSGLLYGAAALGTKGASTLVARYGLLASLSRVAMSPYPYLFVVASVAALALFQTGLQRSRISLVAPLSTVISSVYVVALGMPVFGERFPSDPARSLLRFAGFAAVLVGTFVLAGPGAEGGPDPAALRANAAGHGASEVG